MDKTNFLHCKWHISSLYVRCEVHYRWNNKRQKQLVLEQMLGLVCYIFHNPPTVTFLQLGHSSAFCFVTAPFCFSSPVIISCLCVALLPCLCLRKRWSRNKAINKKSTAFSVPPHYRLLMNAFCSRITHWLQINAIILPCPHSARLISVAVTTAQRGAEQICTL